MTNCWKRTGAGKVQGLTLLAFWLCLPVLVVNGQSIPDNDRAGIVSTMSITQSDTIEDVTLVLDSVKHSCVADLHIELTSPAGTTVTLVKAYSEQGILKGLRCPANFNGTVLDDDAGKNLRDGIAPYTGAYNIEHESVTTHPLSQFEGENPQGEWMLSISDRAPEDTGELVGWHVEINNEKPPIPIPDDDPAGIADTYSVQHNETVEDVNLVFDNLDHVCIADLQIELTSPSGTTVTVIKPHTEDGILKGLPCTGGFQNTVLDDEASKNLRNGDAPYTGAFNIEHESVVNQPLSQFNGEQAQGEWTVHISDHDDKHTGKLVDWHPVINGFEPIPDDDTEGLEDTISITENRTIRDLNLKFESLQHSRIPDLHVELTSPAGKTVTLMKPFNEDGIGRQLGGADTFTETVLDDDAATHLSAGAVPYTGAYNIEHPSVAKRPLSLFNGEQAQGEWTLHVSDRAKDRIGWLVGWDLIVNQGQPNLTIPDNDPDGITDTFMVTQEGSVDDVNLTLSALQHSSIPDLHIELTSPAGTTATLVKAFTEGGIGRNLGGATAFAETVLDDEASVNLSDGSAPYTGTFNVEHAASGVNQPLSTFEGEQAEGQWKLHVSDRAEGDTGELLAWHLDVFSAGQGISIPDNDPDGIEDTLTVTHGGNIKDVNLVLDALSHTYLGDLHIELTSPEGTTKTLIKAGSEEGIGRKLEGTSDFRGTILDDDADTNLGDGSAPYTGRFNVQHTSLEQSQPLSWFDGERADGTWTLHVSDRAAGDTGSLVDWHLEIERHFTASRSLPEFYSPGDTVDVAVTIDHSSDETVTALSVSEELPEGWEFVSVQSTAEPAIQPPANAAGRLDFSWLDIPSLPHTLVYRVKTDAASSGNQNFSGEVTYRTDETENRLQTDGDSLIEQGEPYHDADQNQNWKIELSPELTRVIQFYRSGGYHVEAGTEDGFAPGTGSEAGIPHDSDYDPQDWDIQLSPELTRLIQFYKSGGYHVEAGTEDGFAPDVTRSQQFSRSATMSATAGFTPANTYPDDDTLEVSVTVSYPDSDVSTLAFTDEIPDGWTFERVTSSPVPALKPAQGDTGTLEFTWINTPSFPVTLTYEVTIPANASGPKTFSGRLAYRTTGAEQYLDVDRDFAADRDEDEDGLPDNWEQQIIDADPDDNITSIADVTPEGNYDQDAATNGEEYELGTDPTVADVFTVSFDLAAHGTRSGGGELQQTVINGNSATAPDVQAEEGWTFSGWNSDFSNVTSDITITALYSEGTFHWSPIAGDPAQATWVIVLAGASLDGTPLTAGDEIAVLDAGNGGRVVGTFTLDEELTDQNKFENTLKAYSTLVGGDGYTAGNRYIFRCWDASEQTAGTCRAADAIMSDTTGTYTDETFPEDDGEISIATLPFTTGATQDIELQQGFQLFSTYVQPQNPDLQNVVSAILNATEFVKDSDANLLRQIDDEWINTIGELDPSQGYLIKMNAPATLTVEGTPVSDQTPIALAAGFQLISYTCAQPQDALDAFNGILGKLDFVKDSDANLLRKVGDEWVNTINNLRPGEGYLVKMGDNAELVYPRPTRRTAAATRSSRNATAPTHFGGVSGNAAEPSWQILLAGATLNGTPLETGDEIGIYDDDKLVGAFALSETLTSDKKDDNSLEAWSTLTDGDGYTPGATYDFRYWDTSAQREYADVDVTLSTTSDDLYTGTTFPDNDGQISIVTLNRADPDQDGDGLADAFEMQIIEAEENDNLQILTDVLPEHDFDGDGFPNSVEFAAGTDPTCKTCHPAGWMWTLQVDGAYSNAVTFGMTPDTTDGWTRKLETDTPAEDGTFSILNGTSAYQRDIREEAETAEWFLTATPDADEKITVSWQTPASLPDEKSVVLQEINVDGKAVPGGHYANLRDVNELTIPPGGDTCFFVVRYSSNGVTIELPLKQGWNLVSVPIDPEPADVHSIMDDAAGPSRSADAVRQKNTPDKTAHPGNIWRWNAEAQKYEEVTEIVALEGFWIFVPADTVIEISGNKLDPTDRVWSLDHGWNLVGPPAPTAVPQLESLRGRCWRWDNVAGTNESVEQMKPLQGYWLNYGGSGTTFDLEEN